MTRTDSGGSTTSNGESKSGRASFELALKGSFNDLAGSSRIQISFGDLYLERTLGSDPQFKEGSGKAEFKEFIDASSSVRMLAHTLKLSWTPTLLSMKFEGTLPFTTSLLSESVLNLQQFSGQFKGEGKVTGLIGPVPFEAPFRFGGTIKVVETGNQWVQSRDISLVLNGGL